MLCSAHVLTPAQGCTHPQHNAVSYKCTFPMQQCPGNPRKHGHHRCSCLLPGSAPRHARANPQPWWPWNGSREVGSRSQGSQLGEWAPIGVTMCPGLTGAVLRGLRERRMEPGQCPPTAPVPPPLQQGTGHPGLAWPQPPSPAETTESYRSSH